jgi:hypothetical protein
VIELAQVLALMAVPIVILAVIRTLNVRLDRAAAATSAGEATPLA